MKSNYMSRVIRRIVDWVKYFYEDLTKPDELILAQDLMHDSQFRKEQRGFFELNGIEEMIT